MEPREGRVVRPRQLRHYSTVPFSFETTAITEVASAVTVFENEWLWRECTVQHGKKY